MIQKRYVSLFALAIGLTGILGFFFNQSSDHTHEKLAALRQKGLPTTLEETNNFYVIPDGQKDATLLWTSAIDSLKEIKADPAREALPLVGYGTDLIPAPGESWAQLEASETFIESHQNVVERIHQAAESQGIARYPIDFASGNPAELSYAVDTQLASRVLKLHAWVSLHRGNSSAVFNDIRGMFAASNSLMAEPSLTAQAIRQAIFTDTCQCIISCSRHCEWTDQQLAELQFIIFKFDVLNELQRALIGDRAGFLSTISDARLDQMNQITAESVIDLYEKFIASMATGWAGFLKAHDEVAQAMVDWSPEERASKVNSAVAIVFPAIRQAIANSGETVTQQRASILMLASLRYELANGSKPAGPDQLKPFVDASISAVWTDPFNQQPLTVRKEGTQVLIYGVGRDRKDDLGQIEAEKTSGRPRDVGFRL